MAGQLFVSASKAHRDENKKALRALLFFGSKFTVLAYLPVFFLLLFLGDWIIELWLGRVYQAEDLRLIFRVMVLWSLIDLFFYLEGSSYSVLFGIDQLDFMIKADFMISLLNIAASVVLIKYFNAGLTGVLIPGVCIELFARIGFFINTAKRIGITLKECLMEYFIPLFLAFVLVFVPLWLVHLQHFTLWIRISSVILILALFYPMLCWKLALNHEERTLLSARLRKFVPFLS
jgi:peptidoglycan biosynthesis protein MviN/MurJ (putative lipid II flippase)